MRVIICVLSIIGILEATKYNYYINDIKELGRPILRRSHSINFPIVNEKCYYRDNNITRK